MSYFLLPSMLFTSKYKFKLLYYLSWANESCFFLLSFTRNSVVSVRRSYFFPWQLGRGCAVLLWHPFNDFLNWSPML